MNAKSTVQPGDLVHPCITIRAKRYRRSYVHPNRFVVTRVVRAGVFCRIIDGKLLGRSEFLYRSWVRVAGA